MKGMSARPQPTGRFLDVGLRQPVTKPWDWSYFATPVEITYRLLKQEARRAISRAAWTAGTSSAIRIPMIAITTSSSARVRPRRLR